jgi:hypothetical protein
VTLAHTDVSGTGRIHDGIDNLPRRETLNESMSRSGLRAAAQLTAKGVKRQMRTDVW